MKLYANGILLNAAAQSVTLEKSRGDAAATLTAVLLTAAADRYFPKESLALGDAVRLLGDAGEEVFLGAVQAVSRNVETVTLIACDRGLYLTANELSGVFAGSPEGICRAVAMRLSLPVGTLEVPAGWKRLVAGAGVRAFDILRQAVGEEREISIQNGALTVTKAGQERRRGHPREPAQEDHHRDAARLPVHHGRGGLLVRAPRGRRDGALYRENGVQFL